MHVLDILIRGGTVIDGSGAPRVDADVGIRGGRIVFVGDAGGSYTATRTVEPGRRRMKSTCTGVSRTTSS